MLLSPSDHRNFVLTAGRNVIRRNALQCSPLRKLWQKTYLHFLSLTTCKEKKSVVGYRCMHHVAYAMAKTAVQNTADKTGTSVISQKFVRQHRTCHGIRKSYPRVDVVHTDAMKILPSRPTLTGTFHPPAPFPPETASQQTPTKKSLDKQRCGPQVPVAEYFIASSVFFWTRKISLFCGRCSP